NADFRAALDLGGNLAGFVGEEDDGRVVGTEAVDLADQAAVGDHGVGGGDARLVAAVDFHRLPPGGRLAAGDAGGDDVEAGAFLEVEGAAQAGVFGLDRPEAGFDEFQPAEVLAHGIDLGGESLRVFDL